MSEASDKVREVDWQEVCPWLLLTRCLRTALLVRILVLATLGLIVTTAGWRLISHTVFGAIADPVIEDWRATGCQWVWQSTSHFTISSSDSPDSAGQVFGLAATGLAEAPVALWRHLVRPFVDLFRADLTPWGFLCLFACGVWEALVWGLFGGAITRIAALQLTRGEAPDLGAAGRHALGSLVSYTIAPLMVFGAAAVFAVQLVLWGLAMRVDLLAMLAGFAWPFVLLLGLLMALILLGTLVGWPLMWATISVEGTDAFDAISRSYAYTYQRPFRLLWYILFAGLVGALGMFVVKFFALTTIGLGDWSVSWGLDEPTMQQVVLQPEDPQEVELEGMLRVAAGAILFWKSLLAAVAAGYQAGFLWVAAVGIYLLLRRDIDGVEVDEVFVDDEEPDFGMPPLEDDPSGVPTVNPTGDAQAGDATDGTSARP